MFKNYLTVAIRNLSRHKAYTFINVIGLAIGLTCSTLILLYIQHEFSYDRHHSKADRIYRVVTAQHPPGGEVWYAPGGPFQLASTLAEDYPEIERATGFIHRPHVNVGIEGRESLIGGVMVADDEFFNVFDFPLIQGDAQTGLQNLFSIFITQTFARRLFDQDDPIGKTITLKSKFFDDMYMITGILQDIPETSIATLRPHLITQTLPRSLASYRQLFEQAGRWSLKGFMITYVLLKSGVSAAGLEQKLPDYVQRYLGEERAQDTHFELMPLIKLHLHGKQKYGFLRLHGNINTVYTFGLIGIFMVVVACINFMNLSTARSARRMREVGMRKVVGAKRAQLVYQFLGESVLLSFLSLVFALGFTELTLPMLNGYLNINLSLQPAFLPTLFGLAVGVGLLAGSYPAIFLSSFRPAAVLKVARNLRGGHAYIRKVLGATEVSIVSLLTKEFLLLVGLASVLAYPVAYYTMGGWLENFAYRIELSPAYFIASTGVALVITLVTIAYQALKAARANPVEALRYE